MLRHLLGAMALLTTASAFAQTSYVPAPENLAARQEFQDNKLGIFIHWGVYSVLGRGEWVMNNEQIAAADYEPNAAKFNPAKFDADAWCELFKAAGAQYITITSKHHDGFAMWDTQHSDWDIVDRTPYGQDVLKQLADACERHGLILCFYHSHLDWHHPDYFPRGRTGGPLGRPDSGDFSKYIDYMNAQLTELLDGSYGKVGAIWFDGWWDQKSKDFPETKDAGPQESRVDWRLDDTYSLIHRLQPACLVGSNHHVAPFPGEDFQMFERDLPGQNTSGFSPDTMISQLPLEMCETINGAWGYNASDNSFKSPDALVRMLVNAAGRNANLLINVGPKPDGTIDERSAESLRGLGAWMKQHGEAVYGTRGGPIEPQPWGVTTHRGETVYLHVLDTKSATDGWLTLTGTRDLKAKQLQAHGAADTVESQRDAAGDLQVKVPSGTTGPDWVLVAQP